VSGTRFSAAIRSPGLVFAAALSLMSISCQNPGPKRPDVLMIDGVPHKAVYRDCDFCEKRGYFEKTCVICGGAGSKEIPCVVCFGKGQTTKETPSGPVAQPCTVCQEKGNITLPCDPVRRVVCRPCEGYGRIFEKYEVIEGADW
jgi:hypothetical protein